MTNISLTGSLKNYKVKISNDVGYHSDRRHGSNVLCPPPRTTDVIGRHTSEFGRDNTVTSGCHHPSYLMDIEEEARPKYFNHILQHSNAIRNNNRTGVNLKAHVEHREPHVLR